MKNLTRIAFVTLTLISFNVNAQKAKAKTAAINTNDYALFGEKFAASNVMTNKQMLKKYKGLKKGDSVAVKFQSNIKEVCKKKGCWMNMDLTDDKESFVKFKDYGFFVPLNADNSEAIINGIAFIDVVSVAELKHYAKDGGKSQAEIDKITDRKSVV